MLSDAKHDSPRDAIQVFCNGGLYALLAVADDFYADLWMTISLCTATCDTWASEIGMYARWPTINIATLRRVAPGLSGGISLAGTLGGFGGSMLMGLFICAWDPDQPPEPAWPAVVIKFGPLLLGFPLVFRLRSGRRALDLLALYSKPSTMMAMDPAIPERDRSPACVG